MQISLNSDVENFINSKVQSGLYKNAADVITEGLKLLAEQEAANKKRIELLNTEIKKGINSIEMGNYSSGELVYKQLAEKRSEFKF
jgi:antitoxin ParD1/3/4